MKNSEAIRILGDTTLCSPLGQAAFVGIEAIKKLQKYQEIGTVEECREAVEKQIPKKPRTHQDTNRADCPVCGATVRGIKEPFGDWCSKCGQKLDWK